MRKFIKDNIVLVVGISLPLVLVVFFVLAGSARNMFIEEPQYDVIFSDSRDNRLSFKVEGQKLHFRLNPKSLGGYDPKTPRLYRYHVATKQVSELAFAIPDDVSKLAFESTVATRNVNTSAVINIDPTNPPTTEQAQQTSRALTEMTQTLENHRPVLVPVAEFSAMKLSDSTIAPDGYQFYSGYEYRGGGGLFALGFGRSHGGYETVIYKNGKKVPIMVRPGSDYYAYGGLHFIGWVIP